MLKVVLKTNAYQSSVNAYVEEEMIENGAHLLLGTAGCTKAFQLLLMIKPKTQ